jgi:dihydroxyacid dehydratase/phosphogluconate dehydratase
VLRSQQWLAGNDEVAVSHRVALRSAGLTLPDDLDSSASPKPVIGIADSSSDLNPCNLPLRELAAAAAEGVLEAGGPPVRFPTMSLGEDLMKPSAFLYRNLLAMEIEETIRANPLDGVVVLANCDKTVPAVLMGVASADIPAIAVLGGARPTSQFRGRAIGTGTDLWRLWEDHRAARTRTVPRLWGRRLQHHGHRIHDGAAHRGARHGAAGKVGRAGGFTGVDRGGPRGRSTRCAARARRHSAP